MSETIITVHGEFTSKHEPERATAQVTISHDGESRDVVLTQTAQLHTELQADLAPLHEPEKGPVTEFSAGNATVSSNRPWSQDGTVLPLVHRADATLSVIFNDFDELSRWLATVATHEGVTVHGVYWSLTEASLAEATRGARHQAVQNAVEKATDYAHSLGLDDLSPIALSDVGLSGDGALPPPGRALIMARAVSDSAEAPPVEFTPEPIIVSAAVEARFRAG